jgi:hypothetical protein
MIDDILVIKAAHCRMRSYLDPKRFSNCAGSKATERLTIAYAAIDSVWPAEIGAIIRQRKSHLQSFNISEMSWLGEAD